MANYMEEEKKVVGQMIHLYCRRKECNTTLCPDCRELLEYAILRLDNCRYGNNKPTCKKCPVHCYCQDMRNKIKTIMRWSGPIMIFFHPVVAVRHILHGFKSRHEM